MDPDRLLPVSVSRVLSAALQIAGPAHPQQAAPVHLSTRFLMAPDGSMTSLAEMLCAFVGRVLPDVTFEPNTRYRLALSVEGGLYRLDQECFAGPFELFGVVFLLEGDGATESGSAAKAPPTDLKTDKTSLVDEEGLVVDLAAGQPMADGGAP